MGIRFEPCGDRQTQVGLIAMSCLGCLQFVHKKNNGIKRNLSPRLEFMRSRCQDTPRPVCGRHNEEKLEAVKEFCHLGEMLSAEGSCELIVPMLQVCLGVSLASYTTSHQPSLAILVLTLSDMYSEHYFQPRHVKNLLSAYFYLLAIKQLFDRVLKRQLLYRFFAIGTRNKHV